MWRFASGKHLASMGRCEAIRAIWKISTSSVVEELSRNAPSMTMSTRLPCGRWWRRRIHRARSDF